MVGRGIGDGDGGGSIVYARPQYYTPARKLANCFGVGQATLVHLISNWQGGKQRK